MVSIIASALFIFCGWILNEFPSKQVNGPYGYRSALSKKNHNTWNTAQQYVGFNLIILGIIAAFLGTLLIIFPSNKVTYNFQRYFLIISPFAAMYFAELKLRKVFDKEGNRKLINK